MRDCALRGFLTVTIDGQPYKNSNEKIIKKKDLRFKFILLHPEDTHNLYLLLYQQIICLSN